MTYVGEYIGAIPTNGVYYKFENNGTDTFGHANATAYGSGNYVSTGKMGRYGAYFDNGTNYFTFTPGSTSTQFSTLTAMAWIKCPGTDDGCIIQSLLFSTTYRGWMMRLVGGNEFALYCGNATTSSMAGVASSGAGINNTWQHIAASITGTTVKLYVNGALITQGTSAQAISTSGTHHGRIGQFYNGSTTTYWLNGYLDDVIVFNEVKTDDWIRKYYGWSVGRYMNENSGD